MNRREEYIEAHNDGFDEVPHLRTCEQCGEEYCPDEGPCPYCEEIVEEE
jgi:uncharacterized OB-fold protein